MQKRVAGLVVWIAMFGVTAAAQTNTFPASGNVGIGTTTPGYQLEVDQSPSTDVPISLFSNSRTPGSGNQTHGLSVLSPNALGSGDLASVIETGTSRTTKNLGYMAFVSMGAGSASNFLTFGIDGVDELLNINTSGSVGIGTTSPGAKLEVDGSIKLTASSGASITFQDGTVQSTAYTGVTCGGDYAESVDVAGSRTNYEPGDLLVIDPNAPGRFLKSAEPYSTLVAGIYSTKPGTVGRRETTYAKTDTAEVPMAMMGIVPTKVSAENGPIKTGDLLVSLPPWAMP
jgi:hypothetical protein